MSEHTPGLLDRTLRRFRRAWRFAGKGGGTLKDGVSAHLSDDDRERLKKQIDACLEARGGEVSARSRAAELGEAYLVLDATGKRRFLEVLARDYDIDPESVEQAIAARQSADGESARERAEDGLREALIAPRVKLLRQFNDLSQGVKFLVDLRAELMSFADDDPSLARLDAEIRDLLASWFDIGFLDLKRITWETPASLLEKLIEYEAVHVIRSWEDLKNRLEADRRCYAFFHPGMPDEPLIFVQVALVDGIASNIQRLLDEGAPLGDLELADSAIFYSISNCQVGLAGVSFGSFLIKRVADDLARDLPKLKTFATLSPIPGFRAWLERLVGSDFGGSGGSVGSGGSGGPGGPVGPLTNGDVARLGELPGDVSGYHRLLDALESPGWWEQERTFELLQPILMKLCAYYLIKERSGRRARDRVAHFHLSNGARVERINWMADTSEKGLAQSAGLMVNYRYQLADIEKNHEAYTGEGKVTAATAVKKLLKA